MSEPKEGNRPAFVKTPALEAEMYPKVESYVRDRFGGMSLRKVDLGINLNYSLGDGPDLMLKVGPQPFVGREHHCLRAYGAAGLPVPRVEHFERWNEALGAAVLATQFIQNDGDVKTVKYDEMGALMCRLHAVQAAGVGDLDPREARGVSESWEAYLVQRAIARGALIKAQYGKSPLELIGDLRGVEGGSSLLHGDFHRHNVLQRSGRVVAVIDPHGLVGPGLYDVASTTSSFEDDRRLPFLRGYAPQGLSRDERDVLRLYERAVAMGKLAWFLEVLSNPDISKQRRDWSLERKVDSEKALGLR